MGAGTVEKPKTGKESLDAKVAERKSAAELREAKAAREKQEAENAAKVAKQPTPPNGRAEIDAAHAALGTKSGVVPGHEGSEIHDGDELPDMPPAPGRMVPMGKFVVGGKKPTVSSVRLLGGKVNAPINAEKGDRLVLRVEVVVKWVNHIDEEDAKTGQVIGCERRQGVRITGVSVMDA